MQLAQRDPDPERNVLRHVEFHPDDGFATVSAAAAAEAFYGDCAAPAAARAVSRLGPEPLASPGTPVRITPERFGRVPRAYARTLSDRADSPALQDAMVAASPAGG